MSEILICRKHGKTASEARASAEHLAAELKEEFDLDSRWDGNVLRFKRAGVSGELTLADDEAHLRIQLGFLLSAIKPTVEREVHKFFDENFAA